MTSTKSDCKVLTEEEVDAAAHVAVAIQQGKPEAHYDFLKLLEALKESRLSVDASARQALSLVLGLDHLTAEWPEMLARVARMKEQLGLATVLILPDRTRVYLSSATGSVLWEVLPPEGRMLPDANGACASFLSSDAAFDALETYRMRTSP